MNIKMMGENRDQHQVVINILPLKRLKKFVKKNIMNLRNEINVQHSHLNLVQSMMVNGREHTEMDLVFRLGEMVLNMKDNGKKIKLMGEVNLYI